MIMVRHELNSKEYIKNEKMLNNFLKRINLKNKIVGYTDTIGHYGQLENIDDMIELAEVIDLIATFGGYVYVYKNGVEEKTKEFECK